MGEPVTSSRRESLRVAVVTSRLWPGFNDLWDAAGRHVKELAVVGARPHNVAHSTSPRRVALPAVGLRDDLVWEHLRGLRRFVREFQPDLLHVNRELWALASQETVALDMPVVVHGAENLWSHGGRTEQKLRRRLVDRAVRHLAGYASWNHAGVDHVVRRREASGLPAFPTLVLPAVVPPAPFRERRWTPPDDDVFDVLLVGRVVTAKGFSDVVRAAAGLDRVRLTVAGQGEGLRSLRQLGDDLGVDIRARGQLPPEELSALMSACDLLVQPSRTTHDWAEQFGRTVAEAMTLGLPCLVSDSGELPHLVDHDPEALFIERDITDLQRHLELLSDPSVRGRVAARQRARAAIWEPENAAEAVLTFWEQVVS